MRKVRSAINILLLLDESLVWKAIIHDYVKDVTDDNIRKEALWLFTFSQELAYEYPS
jgi:hypothetical protein